ncbi:NUDIX hydrolase [Actinorugispora endophytica]|uniref:ADP-ribose pyrophosphatase YjhB (NUDIX family) n=1 Tax=Actinorugispora endophytica TaxID=1605990 RepID=A0A4R6V2T2_9ACTN|nr:NUDIX domain-containing protein [Actinorugispora endophytica]TDQ52990.1 ADP-ribose pyrophosphatase YjhB (NUDIX family) [Actinorugispora endophytica]
MARTEYYDDPAAPVPNSTVVAASAAVFDTRGRLLMQRRADSGLWALPGGAMEPTESLPETAVRETREETGIDIEITGLVGTYTDPRHVIAYTDGEVRRQFNVCFRGRPLGGALAVSGESTLVRWIPRGELDALPMHHTQRLRVGHALVPDRLPHLG